MTCECLSRMAGEGPQSWGEYHHVACPKYKTEKIPRLFYYEEAIGAYVPAPKLLENIINIDSHFSYHGEMEEIQFKRMDMTDEEFMNLPDGG